MNTLRQFLFRLGGIFRKRKHESDMSAELQAHLELRTERNIQNGMTPEEARYAAMRSFGGVEQIKEIARDQRRSVWLETLGKDLRFASRRLRRTPAFTVTALITLALCIGSNTAIFAIVDALVLRPLPFPASEHLMTVVNSYPGIGNPHGGPSIPNYFERRESIRAFASLAVFQPLNAVIGEPGNVRNVEGARVTPHFFATLGVPLAMGRMFTHDELTYQTAGGVVLTDEFWQSQFGGDPNVIGKTLITDGLPSLVIGVLPPGFRFLSSRAQFYRPLAFNPPERALANRHNSLTGTIMVARLAPGATPAEAQTQLDALDARQAEVDPKGPFLKAWGYHSLVRPLHADYIREIRPTLLLLQGGVLVLLLIGILNLTNLLLVRAGARSRELAVRQALGASRGRLTRDMWLETTLLALGGGALGMAVGAAGVRLLMTLGANQIPLGSAIALDGRGATIVLAATLVMGGLLAIAPTWFVRRLSINAQLQNDTGGLLPGGASQRLRQILGTAQIALAFVLLCGAGVLGLSLKRTLEQPVGFVRENTLVARITLPWKGYPSPLHQAQFAHRLEQEMASLPGGVQFAISDGLPFTGVRDGPVAIEGRAGNTSETVRTHHYSGVTVNYWHAMGIPLLRGRLLGDEEIAPKTPPTCVIDQAVADTYWPGGDPIGQRLSFGTTFNPRFSLTVVGVVGNVKEAQLTEGQPHGMIYFHFVQFPESWMRLVLRGSLPPRVMAETLRKKVQAIDPELLVTGVKTMEELIDDSLLTRRSPALLATLFGGMALFLSAVGTYGVIAYAVSHRRREIGVRLALGALPRQVMQLFLVLGLKLLLAGYAFGLIGAWATCRAMRSLLFEVSVFPPSVVGGVGALMGCVVLVAIVLPAMRAASVAPCETLRHE